MELNECKIYTDIFFIILVIFYYTLYIFADLNVDVDR